MKTSLHLASFVAFLCAALFLGGAAPLSAAEEDTIGGGDTESAASPDGGEDWRGQLPEQFWYLEPDVQARMAKDPNVVPMFERARAAKVQRRTAGTVLYFVGAPIMVASFVLFVAPEDLGFKADEADVISITGAGVGAVTILTAALLRGLELPAEKRFKTYIKDRYDVIPVVTLPHVRGDGVVAWNLVTLEF